MKKIIVFIVISIMVVSMVSCAPKDLEVSVDTAEDLIKDGKVDDAIDMLEDILDEDETDLDAWKLLTETYIEVEEYEDAAKVLEDLVDMFVDNYEEIDERDREDIIDIYEELTEDIVKEEDSIEIVSIQLILSDALGLTDELSQGDDSEGQEDLVEKDDLDKDDVIELDDNLNQGDGTELDTILLADLNTEGLPSFERTELQIGESYIKINTDGSFEAALHLSRSDVYEELDIVGNSTGNELLDAFEDWTYMVAVDIEEVKEYIDSIFFMMSGEDFTLVADYYETIQDYIDIYGYGKYDMMEDNYPFYIYDTNNEITADDFELNANDVVICIDTGAEGTYYDMPYDIKWVTEEDYKWIEDHIIYVDNYIELTLEKSIKGFGPESIYNEDLDSGTNPVLSGTVPDSQNNMEIDQMIYEYKADGSLQLSVNGTYEDILDEFEYDEINTEEKLEAIMLSELDGMYDGEVSVDAIMYVSTVTIIISIENASELMTVYKVGEIVDTMYDGDIENFIVYEELMNIKTNELITAEEVEQIGDYLIYSINCSGDEIVILPSEILYVSATLEYTQTNPTTLEEVDGWGYVILKGE